MPEQPDDVPRVFELVDVRPDLGLPGSVMGGGFAAGSAARMQTDCGSVGRALSSFRQLDKDAADVLDLLVRADQVLVTQKVPKSQLSEPRIRPRIRVWKGPYSARTCSVESQAIQKVSL